MTSIPQKTYFKIGEVSEIADVKSHVLRFWESEFKLLSPNKSKGKQRVYTRRDVEVILHIKELLKNDKFTIEGAKKKIKEVMKADVSQMSMSFEEKKHKKTLKKVKKELDSLRGLISKALETY